MSASKLLNEMEWSDPAANYCGDSDSGLIFLVDDLNILAPEAKWVFINRDRSSAEQSFKKFFSDKSYGGVPPMMGWDSEAIFDQIEAKLDECRSKVDEGRVMEVHFEDLETERQCQRLWEFCVPGEKFNRSRWKMLNALRVNPIPEKIDVSQAINELILHQK